MRRILIRLFITVLILAGTAVTAFVWIASSQLLSPNRRDLEPRHREILAEPERFGLKLEPFEAVGADGTRLAGLIATRAAHPGEARKTRGMARRLGTDPESDSSPLRTVVILHGRSGLKEDMLAVAERFVAADFRCILYDSRCHGRSGGSACTFGKNESADLRAVLNQVELMLANRGETTGPLTAFGISMGAAVMLQSLPGEPRIAAAVAVAPFADLSEIVERSARRGIHARTPPWLVASALQTAGLRGRYTPSRIRPIEAMESITIPLLFVHGEKDAVIPAEHTRRLVKAAAGPVEMRLVDEGSHGDVLAKGGDDLYEQMVRFLLSRS